MKAPSNPRELDQYIALRAEQPLRGLIVVEIARSLAANFAGAMLADFGATVVKAEGAELGLDPVRRLGPTLPGEDSIYFQSESRNKLSFDLTEQGIGQLESLLSKADGLVEDLGPDGLEGLGLPWQHLHGTNGALCALRISPFGLDGPRAHDFGNDRVAQAYCGMLHVTGLPGEPPILVPHPLAEYWTGLHGASGLLVALENARRTGHGQVVDLAMYETALRIQEEFIVQYDQLGIVRQRMGNEYAETVPSNHYPTSDGKWVAISAAGIQPFVRVCEAMGNPAAAQDDRFSTPDARLRYRADVNELIATWTITRTAEDIIETFSTHGAPAALVQSVDDILEDRHVRAREDIAASVSQRGRPLQLPARFPRLSGSRPFPTEPAPFVGQDQQLVAELLDRREELELSEQSERSAGHASTRTQERTGPLTHLRVVDIGRFIAGPFCATILGEFGAEVIKIELPSGDSTRSRHPLKDGVGLSFEMTNRNKLSTTLDLHHEDGRRLFLDLMRTTDVLVENFRPGTLERWNLGPEVLHATNPGLVVLRASGFGQTGPYRDRSAFDRIGLAAGGISYLGGRPDGPPLRPGVLASDYSTALFGFFGVLAALRDRRLSGRGQVVDSTLYEAILRMSGDLVGLRTACDVRRERDGGASPLYPYACTGRTKDGVDVLVCAAADASAAQQSLKRAGVTCPEGPVSSRDFRTAVSAWLSETDLEDCEQSAQDSGLALQRINSASDLIHDEHLWARGSLVHIDHPKLGTVTMQGVVPRLEDTPGKVRLAPEQPGAHNSYVYKELLGLDEREFVTLSEQRII